MALKDDICKAFCEGVSVTPFRKGFAISTPYLDRFGDRISMYALSLPGGYFKIIDNALTVARLEADCAPVLDGTRRAIFAGLLNEYGAHFDEEFGEIVVDDVAEANLPRAVIQFASLLMRTADLLFLNRDRVENTFREDAKSLIKKELLDKAEIQEDEPVSEGLSEVIPDVVIRPFGGGIPVAVFMVTTESRLWQAIHLRLIASYEVHQAVSIVALLESEEIVSKRIRVQADNRLDAVPRFKDGPRDAIQRVVRAVLGPASSVH